MAASPSPDMNEEGFSHLFVAATQSPELQQYLRARGIVNAATPAVRPYPESIEIRRADESDKKQIVMEPSVNLIIAFRYRLEKEALCEISLPVAIEERKSYIYGQPYSNGNCGE